MTVRNRIKYHKTIKAGDLVPNPRNWRTHDDKQKSVVLGILKEVGLSRSLLAYELPDGRLMLIDGHLRQSLDPEMEVTVEVLDVNAEEALKLLMVLDPSSAMAGTDSKMLKGNFADLESGEESLNALWSDMSASAGLKMDKEKPGKDDKIIEDIENLEVSHVRMVQLFLNTETINDYEERVTYLMERYGLTTPTEVVMKALEKEMDAKAKKTETVMTALKRQYRKEKKLETANAQENNPVESGASG